MSDNSAVRIFSMKAGAAPLKKAVRIFEEETGIKVAVSVCSRKCMESKAEEAHQSGGMQDFLVEISEAGIYDLAVAGAEYLLDDGEVMNIMQRGERRTIASREAAIIVQSGNPKGIHKLEDLTRPGIRIGISVIDCLKGLWEDVCARQGLLDPIRRNITFYACGCLAIIEAVAEGKVDAAFGWSAFKHLEPERIEIISLPDNQSVLRGTGVGLLKLSKNVEDAKKLMNFLTTKPAQECYLEYGWVL